MNIPDNNEKETLQNIFFVLTFELRHLNNNL